MGKILVILLIVLVSCEIQTKWFDKTTHTGSDLTDNYDDIENFELIEGDEPLEVYLISHSHTDAGWIETYDSYYVKVKKIIESVLDALKWDPSLKFNWADTSFLAKWYRETDSEYREIIHELVESK